MTIGARGPWGSETFYCDGVGNRIEHRATPPGGSQTIASLGYPATSNRVTQITQNASLALRCRFTLRAEVRGAIGARVRSIGVACPGEGRERRR